MAVKESNREGKWGEKIKRRHLLLVLVADPCPVPSALLTDLIQSSLYFASVHFLDLRNIHYGDNHELQPSNICYTITYQSYCSVLYKSLCIPTVL